jgi:hypothetical protein
LRILLGQIDYIIARVINQPTDRLITVRVTDWPTEEFIEIITARVINQQREEFITMRVTNRPTEEFIEIITMRVTNWPTEDHDGHRHCHVYEREQRILRGCF